MQVFSCFEGESGLRKSNVGDGGVCWMLLSFGDVWIGVWYSTRCAQECQVQKNPFSINRSMNFDSSKSTHGEQKSSLSVTIKVVSLLTVPCGTTPSSVGMNVGM